MKLAWVVWEKRAPRSNHCGGDWSLAHAARWEADKSLCGKRIPWGYGNTFRGCAERAPEHMKRCPRCVKITTRLAAAKDKE